MRSNRTATRAAVVREIRRTMREQHGRNITDSDARAMLRGECTTPEYRIAYAIARAYGLDD
jgi:hypothetical protein